MQRVTRRVENSETRAVVKLEEPSRRGEFYSCAAGRACQQIPRKTNRKGNNKISERNVERHGMFSGGDYGQN